MASTSVSAVPSLLTFSVSKKRKLDATFSSRGLSYATEPIVTSDNIAVEEVLVSEEVVTNISSSDSDVTARRVLRSDLRYRILAVIAPIPAFSAPPPAACLTARRPLPFGRPSATAPPFAAVAASVTPTKPAKGKGKAKGKAKKKQ